ncbi:hypothetical protein LINPERPRIM_LOCUS8091 [Linum perenne]
MGKPNQSHTLLPLFLSFLILSLLCSASIVVADGDNSKSGSKGLVGVKMGCKKNEDECLKKAMEKGCKKDDTECLKRRMISEAHSDYIYTQDHGDF